jgi:hypothetical protein
MDNVRFGNSMLDFDSQFHHCFWMGDLNYRVDLALARGGDLNVDNKDRFAEVQEVLAKGDYQALLAADQLRHAMKTGQAFSGFSEGDPSFQPTFKVRRSAGFVYNPQRVSSWCDRVLWKSLPGFAADVKQTAYEAHPSVITSDHKPVSASFDVVLRNTPPCVPFAPTAPSNSLKGPIIRVTGLAGHGLLGMDVSGKSDVYALFYSDRDLRGPKASKPPKTSTIRQTVDPKWPDEHVDNMRISASTFADLSHAHLMVVLMDKDVDADDRMGQAVLQLREAAAKGGKWAFDVPVTKAGRQHGRLTGALEVVWPSADGSSVEVHRRVKATCCAVM